MIFMGRSKMTGMRSRLRPTPVSITLVQASQQSERCVGW